MDGICIQIIIEKEQKGITEIFVIYFTIFCIQFLTCIMHKSFKDRLHVLHVHIQARRKHFFLVGPV